MKVSLKFPFFRKDNVYVPKHDTVIESEQINSIEDNSLNHSLEESEIVVSEVPKQNILEDDLLLKKNGRDKIDSFLEKYSLFGMNLEKLPEHLLKIFDNSPEFLDFVLEQYISLEILDKVSKNELQLKDIPSYSLELLNFPIFKEEEEEKASILRKELVLQDKDYAAITPTLLQEKYLPTDIVQVTIPSYFSNVEIETVKKKILPISVNPTFYKDQITILSPRESSEIMVKDFFNQYLEGEIVLNHETIIILPYDMFLSLSDHELQIIKECSVVLKEDFDKRNKITENFLTKKPRFFPNMREFENNHLVKMNHLLYILEHSSLPEERKKYYSYHFKNYYHQIKEENFFVSIQFDLQDLVEELSNEIDLEEIHKQTKSFNQLSFLDKSLEIDKEKFSVDIFLNGIKNFDDVDITALCYKMKRFDKETKNEIFLDERIRNKFKKSIFLDSKNDIWAYFRKLLESLAVQELFSLFDENYLKKFLKGNNKGYVLFASACEKNLNQTIETVLKEDYLFDEFFKQSNYYYSMFGKLDYPLLKQVIDKMEKNGLPYSNDFICSISEKNQYQLLKEPISDETLFWMIKQFRKEVQRFFFQHDNRATYLYSRFNVIGLAQNGVKFNSSIIESPEFFEKLKNQSLIRFRENINILEGTNPSIVIEEKAKKYYEQMIKSYQQDSGLFDIYQDILENPDILYNIDGKDYILSFPISSNLFSLTTYNAEKQKLTFGNNKGKAYQFFKEETGKKLSEIIVDYLFQDNIYHVWLNIKEMLRYNNLLDKEEKVLNEDSIKFYETILNIDKMENSKKVEFFEKFKDQNINFMFYQDLRKLKDLSYQNMKKDMIKLGEHPEFLDKEQSNKYGVSIYDLRDKEYTMLVRCMGRYRDKSGYRRNCYTLLSNENNSVFNETSYIYGYEGFDDDCVMHVFEGDSYSGDTGNRENTESGSRFVNRIISSEQVVKGNGFYSEIQIVNKKDPHSNMFDALKPSFLVVFDEVCEEDVCESKRLGIPIVILKHQELKREDVIDMNYDRIHDTYYYFDEDYLRRKR